MSGEFLTNSILLRNSNSVIDVVNIEESSALVTEQNSIKEVDILYQKQIKSWSSNSWDKFTCGALKVITSDAIYAVINHHIVWRWQTCEYSLENVKKVSFKTEIKKLLMINETICLIFKTGLLQPLSDAIKTKKNPKKQIVGVDEEIQQIKIISNEKYSILTTNKESTKRRIYVIDIESSVVIPELTVEFDCENICKSFVVDSQLISLYSNGDICSKNILAPDIKFPGPIRDRLSLLNANKDVNIMESGDHAVFQGRAIDDEGDYLILWNYKYRILVDQKRIKMSLDAPTGWSLCAGLAIIEGNTLGYISLRLRPTCAAIMIGIGVKGKNNNKNKGNTKISELSIVDGNSSHRSMAMKEVCQLLKRSHMSEKRLITILSSVQSMPDETFDINSKLYLHENEPFATEIYNDIELPYSRAKFIFINLLLATPYTSNILLTECDQLELGSVSKFLEHLLCMFRILQTSSLSVQGLTLDIIADWMNAILGANWMTILGSFSRRIAELMECCYEETVKIESNIEKLIDCKSIAKYCLNEKKRGQLQINNMTKKMMHF